MVRRGLFRPVCKKENRPNRQLELEKANSASRKVIWYETARRNQNVCQLSRCSRDQRPAASPWDWPGGGVQAPGGRENSELQDRKHL